MRSNVEVVIVGAGPYGLSVAAHLHHASVSLRIFGSPMQTWREHMPKGMLLKSDGFASSLSEPTGKFTIGNYCASHSIPYDDLKVPVKLDTFINYGMAFQKNFVPDLDPRTVTYITGEPGAFQVTLEDGEQVTAKQIVVAAGITHFDYIPENLSHLPANLLSHSASQNNPSLFSGRKVTVLGGGASAIDLAVLLHEAGADVTVVARRKGLRFLEPPPPNGRSPGMKSRFYCDAPGLFRRLPVETRLRLVETSLGPAPGWPMRERLIGKVPTDLGISELRAEEQAGQVLLRYKQSDGSEKELLTQHVVAATGYRVDLRRLPFLDDAIRKNVKTIREAPVLSAKFESSVPGLYFVGIAAAYSFGPLMRFAYGADFAAHRVGKHLSSNARKVVVSSMVAQLG
jgi:thioredoxin reductase